MNVPAKSEYGLQALMHLAEHGAQGLIPAREIAASGGIPVKYLEQILKHLGDGGLVEGHVGAGGGYRLTRPARFITAGEAIRLLDERLGLGETGGPGSRKSVLPGDALGQLWARVEEGIQAVVDVVTIADLCAWRREARETARTAS